MKIAVVGFHFGLLGGLEIVSKAIATAAAAKHEVTCLALHESGITEHSQFRVHGLLPTSRIIRSIRARFPRLLPSQELCDHLAASDLIICAHAGTLPACLSASRRTNLRPQTYCWLHGREVWGEAGRDLLPVLSKCDRLISVSHYTADTVSAMMPRCRRPDVIPNPVDTNVFTPAVTNDQIRRYSILTVGRHDADSEHKGYDVLINAISLLRNRRPDLPISLTITGTGELIERHKATIASLGLQNTVFLAGKVTRETLVRLYQTTDVFAFPSRITVAGGTIYGEGFGVVNIEAAACGRPVITSTHGGCPETIVDGLTGFLVDPTSVSAVTGAIETMFAMSHEDRDQMGLRGRALAVQRFSSQQFQRNIAKIISPA